MKKVYLIGDCQSLRLYGHHIPNKYIDFKIWGLGNTLASAYYFDPEKLKEENVVSGHPARIHQTEPIKDLSFAEITDDGLIISWLGYQDIMFFLPKYDNAEIIVKQYLDKLISAFPNSKIIIAQPHPQFKEFLKEDYDLEKYSYEQRMIQNNNFCNALEKYCSEYGIEIITQEQMLNFMGLKELNISNTAHGTIDELEHQYLVKLYNLFMKRIYDKLMRES